MIRLENLSSEQRQAAQMLSVLFVTTSTAALTRALQGLSEGRWTAERVKAVLGQLERLQVVDEIRGQYRCKPEVVEILTRQAAAEGKLEALAAGISLAEPGPPKRRGLSSGPRGYKHRDEAMRDLRLAVQRHDEAAFLALLESAWNAWLSKCRPHPFLQLGAQPFDAAWMEALPSGILEVLCEHLALEEGESLGPFFDWLEGRLLSGLAVVGNRARCQLAWRALKQGRLPAAGELLRYVEVPAADALRGLMSLMRGDAKASVEDYNRALSGLRKAARKRSETFHSDFSVFHTLALVSTRQLDEAEELIAAVRKTKGHPLAALYSLLELAVRLARGEVLDAEKLPNLATTGGVATLLSAAIHLWSQGAVIGSLRTKLESCHAMQQQTGNRWLAAELAEILGQGNADWKERARREREAMGTQTMLDALERIEPWQRTLTALEEFHSPPPAQPTGHHDTRLIWHVELGSWGVSLNPREQKLSKKGWSAGRPVALKRLSENWSKMVHLSSADRAICAEIEEYRSGYYGHVDYVLEGNRAVAHLIGHPLVFLQSKPDVQLEVLASSPTLKVEVTETEVLLRLAPYPDDDTHTTLERPNLLWVTRFSGAHRRLAGILGKKTRLPLEAWERLQTILPRLASEIAIETTGAPVATPRYSA